MKHLRGHLAIMASALLLVSACKKDEPEDPDPPVSTEHSSVLSDTENWKTIAYSDDFFTGSTGTQFTISILADIVPLIGAVKDGRPFYMSQIVTGNWTTPTFRKGELLVKDENKMIRYDINFPIQRISSDVPNNIWNQELEDNFSYYGYHRKYEFLEYKGKMYAWSNVHDYLNNLNYWVERTNIRFIKDQDGEDFGWFSYANTDIFEPQYFDSTRNKVEIYNGAKPALTQLNGQLAMVYGGEVPTWSNSQTTWKPCVVAKYWNQSTDSIDLVEVIEHDPSFEFNEFAQGITIATGSKILYVYNNLVDDVVTLFHGDFDSGFQQIESYTDLQFYQQVHDNGVAYLICATTNGDYKAIKVTESGTVSIFDIENTNAQSSFCVYQGDLIASLNANGTNGIYKIDAAGATSLGDSKLLNEESSRIYLASDNSNLFAAVLNQSSPGFATSLNQFRGFEFIEYQP